MARFCTQCGRPLAEGEVCQCQMEMKGINQQTFNSSQNDDSVGKGTDREESKQTEYSFTVSTENWVPIRKLIGIGESNFNDVEGCFEREKNIVPDLIAPCDQEISVKQYHICNARSRLQGLWQEGKIQVTNKRILFRLSGRSWIGRAMSHTEFTIDEVAGVSISNGVRFAMVDFFVGFLISILAFQLGKAMGEMPAILTYILGIVLMAPFFVVKKQYFVKAFCLAGGIGMFLAGSVRIAFEHPFWTKIGLGLCFISLILYIIALFLFALKPSLSISVMTKCASDKPIHIWSRQTMVSIMEILPGEDADEAIEELGSMIMDIQKLGDFGIQKWKEE